MNMVDLMRRIFGLFSGRKVEVPPPAVEPPDPPPPVLNWIEADSNPFGVRILDCRPFTQETIPVTNDPEIAARYLSLRQSDGREYKGRSPEDSATIECRLAYPYQGEVLDGILFKAQQMGDKWDIYLYDGHIYFARSWTGDLVFRARLASSGEEVVLTELEAGKELADGQPQFAVRQVDFLVKSHLFRRAVPHPLPEGFPEDPRQIAAFSMSQFGRWASYATYADTR